MTGVADQSYWLAATARMQRACDATLFLPCWEYSQGTRSEMEYARQIGSPIFVMDSWRDLRSAVQWAAAL